MDHAEYMGKIVETIVEHGVAIQGVGGGEGQPQFAYTVGLAAAEPEHPEFIMFGLPITLMHSLLNDLAARVLKQNVRFHAGQELHNLVRDYPVRLIQVDDSSEHLTVANALFREGPEPIPALQVIFPDKGNVWPWDGGGMSATPLLGTWTDPTEGA